MRTVSSYRIPAPLGLALVLLGTFATNCDDCGDVDTTGAPQPAQPSPGQVAPVLGCVGKIASTSLNAPTQCQGMNLGGEELRAFNPTLSRCPDGASYAATDRFQVYWTFCNTAQAAPTTSLPYTLEVRARQGGATLPTPVATADFVQPALAPCACKTEIVVFNSPTEPGLQLGPGSYFLTLTSIYAPGQVNFVNGEQIQINP
jgi:hypothetical protein